MLVVPHKQGIVIPDWILELSEEDDCLGEVLGEAWFAQQKALVAIEDRGNEAPRTCVAEMQSAEIIMENIRDGRVPQGELVEKATQALRKFATARQCARFLQHDSSPRFAKERPRRRAY